MKLLYIHINKCYKLLFHYRNFIKNIAFWIFLFIFLCHTIFIFCVKFPNKTHLYSTLNKISKGSPSYQELTSHEYFQKTSTNSNSENPDALANKKLNKNILTKIKSRRIITDIYIQKPRLMNNYPFWVSGVIVFFGLL